MAVHECQREVFIPNVCAGRLFNAYCQNYQHIMPKIAPDNFSHIEYLEGSGEVGTVKQIHWAYGDRLCHEKRKIDVIDKVNFTYNYTVFESHAFAGQVEKACYQTMFISEAGGVRIKKIANYHHNVDVEIIKEHAEQDLARTFDHYHGVGHYLRQNPSHY